LQWLTAIRAISGVRGAVLSLGRAIGAGTALIGCALLSAGISAAPLSREHLTVELIAKHSTLVPGASAWLGLRLVHEPHWHTYWRNPGDSGLPTKLRWQLPDGITASEIHWPAPDRIRLGELRNFGYEGEMVLPVRIEVPDNLPAGAQVSISLDADWLICKEECIPDKATLSIDLPVTDQAVADARWQKLFEQAEAGQPLAMSWQGRALATGNDVSIRIEGSSLPDIEGLDAFPIQTQLLSNGDVQFQRDGADLLIQAVRNEYFSAAPSTMDVVLTQGQGASRRAWSTTVSWQEAGTQAASADAAGNSSTPVANGYTMHSLALSLLFAFLGGILLNLMPCVFPVLSLKALSIAESAHAPKAARRDGLAYLLGCVLSFVALASVLLILRGMGQQLGWGFQLQSPLVVGALIYVMVALGLALSGVYLLGAGLTGLGQSLTEGQGMRSAFFTGVLACVVASPCTAPLMGPALGFALTQSAGAALAVFAALGLGLAFPIFILGWLPGLRRVLPRPGPWMNTLKQVLAWPLYLTAVWLLWVLMLQVGADASALLLAGLVVFIAALHGYGRLQLQSPALLQRLALLGLCLLGLSPLIAVIRANDPAPRAATSTHQAWSMQQLDELRAEGKPVFVNLTAAWCITCLANERLALSSDAFFNQLRDHDVRYLKGDWTRRDPTITAYLAQFGRSGVPLYLVYPRGGGEPELLPQLLTPALVSAALSRAGSENSATDTRSHP
jgi:thiol:disulfide interchange protein